MQRRAEHPQTNDVLVQNSPADSVSAVCFNPEGNMLAASAWDGSVSCYALTLQQSQQAGSLVTAASPHARVQMEAPVLDLDVLPDSQVVFAGGDNTVRLWNVQQNATATQQIGAHDQPVRNVRMVPDSGLVISSSWDGTVKAWDPRQQNPAFQLQFQERVYAMDAKGQALVVGTAAGYIHIYDMSQNNRVVAEIASPLDYQTRCISIFNDCMGFAVGCVEGRVAIEYFHELQRNRQRPPRDIGSFVFKCHRDKNEQNKREPEYVYAVNDIAFHHYNTFVTAGSDGVFAFWDKDSKHRLRAFDRFKRQCSLTAAAFAPNGFALAYAVGYDWSKGHEHYQPYQGAGIYIHNTTHDEIKKKDPSRTRR